MTGSQEGDSATVGIAIPIPSPYAEELQSWRKALNDPMADAIPTHITLQPPTPVTDLEPVVAHLRTAAAAVAPFQVVLFGTDTFRPHSQVVYVKLLDGVEGCQALQAAVHAGPLATDLSFPYHPHVTIAHDVDEASLDRGMAELADYTVSFTVRGFGLYEHGADDVWREQTYFPLTGA